MVEDFIRRSIHRLFGGDALRDHASRLEDARNSLKSKLGFDPGLFTALAFYLTHESKLIQDPVIISKKELERLQDNALCDDLTQLGNRRLFNLALSKEFERARRAQDGFSLIMLDVDYFKRYNDSYGHMAGDNALSGIGYILRNNSRKSDYAVRYGGEEFALLLPGTNLDNSLLLAERLRKNVERHAFEHASLTVSLGVSTFRNNDLHCFEVVDRADKALYRSKELSRNTICVSDRDNRRHPRFALRIPVQITKVRNGSQSDLGESVNISRGGMLINSNLPLQDESTVRTDLFSPRGTHHVELCGKVVKSKWDEHYKRSSVALQFIDDDAPARFEEFFSTLIFNNQLPLSKQHFDFGQHAQH